MAKKSIMTLSEAETARRRAVTGLRNLGDGQAAEKFERMSAREYAADRGVEIIGENRRGYSMARKTQAEVVEDLKDRLSDLEDQVEELQEENESLQGRLDAAADAIAGDEEAEDESDLEEADDDADAEEDDD